MKVLVISDTHGNVNRAFTAHTRSEPVDVVIHLGDGSADADLMREALDVPIINVAGNCDPGDAYQVKSGLARLRQRAEEIGVDSVLFGHTHLGVLENHAGLLLVNPGTLSNVGHHCSYAVLIITSEGITSRHYDID